ncbi:MAG: helix-turn-helix transcriptional regulator [Actinobacteria bacterium]|nr:helix-turn-helix transcriptional regulator [Actinomycetota bacterium]
MPSIHSSATQADAAVAALETHFPGVQIGSARGQQLEFSMTASVLPSGLGFLDFTIGGRPLTTAVEDTGGFMFARAVRMRGDMSVGRDEVDPLQPYLIRPGLRSRYDLAHARVLTIDTGVFLAQLRDRVPHRGGAFAFTGHGPRTPSHGRYWDAVMDAVEHAIEAGTTKEPLVASSLLDLIVTSSLACFSHTWEDAAFEAPPTVPVAVRRARDFIHDNAHRPITAADIARAARMSVRGLQNAFAREYQTSPHEYLRAVRLAEARHALLRSSPAAGDTVAGIARRCGFAHAARFAALYRSTFGENPSQTLARTEAGQE